MEGSTVKVMKVNIPFLKH
jgi:hypothetical protein